MTNQARAAALWGGLTAKHTEDLTCTRCCKPYYCVTYPHSYPMLADITASQP